MNNYFWLVVLPNLDSFFGTLGVVGLISCVIGGFIFMHKKIEAYNKEDHENAWKFAKKMFIIFGISMSIFFVTVFIPSKKDIVQLKIISVVSEIKGVEQIPQKLINKLNLLLEDDHVHN